MILDAEINRRPIEGNPYCIFPEQIAIEKLYLHQAAIDSITVNESYINSISDRELEYYINNAGSAQKLEEYMRRPISQLRDEIRTRNRTRSMAQQMQAKLVEKIEATPAEVRRYFSNIPADSFLPSLNRLNCRFYLCFLPFHRQKSIA